MPKSESPAAMPAPAPIDGNGTAAVFIRAALQQHAQAATGYAAAVISNGDLEAIHQLRVQLVKARIALAVLASLGCDHRRLRRALGRLRRALAPARDWTVLVQAIDQGDYRLTLAARKRARVRLAAAVAEAQQMLAQPDHVALLARLVAVAGAPAVIDDSTALSTLARQRLLRAWRRLRRRARRLEEGDEARHRVRLAAKRLRYLLELFAPGWTPAEDIRVLKPLRQLQATLGAAQDAHVQRQLLSTLGVEPGPYLPGAADNTQVAAEWQTVRRRWKDGRPLLRKGMKTEYGTDAVTAAS